MVLAMSAETMKMPDPIMEPTTTIVESYKPRPRLNSVSSTVACDAGLPARAAELAIEDSCIKISTVDTLHGHARSDQHGRVRGSRSLRWPRRSVADSGAGPVQRAGPGDRRAPGRPDRPGRAPARRRAGRVRLTAASPVHDCLLYDDRFRGEPCAAHGRRPGGAAVLSAVDRLRGDPE